MIIKFDTNFIEQFKANECFKDNQDVLTSINNLFTLSSQKHHFLILDILIADFLLQEFGEELDLSTRKEIHFLRNSEVMANKVYLKKLPYHINISLNHRIESGKVALTANDYYPEGSVFNINLLSLGNNHFLGERFSIASENTSDIEFYLELKKLYSKEFFNSHIMGNHNSIDGQGGNFGEILRRELRNDKKILILADTDKVFPTQEISQNSTYFKAHQVYLENRRTEIIGFVNTEFHEKENLIPGSWIAEFSSNQYGCNNLLRLELSELSDRILYLDYKNGLTKKCLKQSPELFDYYFPVLKYLEVDFETLKDEEQIIKKIPAGIWRRTSKEVFQSKTIQDYPTYLFSHVQNIALHIIGWLIGGRNGIV